MTHIEFFKLQAKNLLHDWKEYKENGLTPELKRKSKFLAHSLDLIYSNMLCDLSLNGVWPSSLARAQHYIAKAAGFNKWAELVNTDEKHLELARVIFQGINCPRQFDQWRDFKWNSLYEEVTVEKQIQFAKLFFARHGEDFKEKTEQISFEDSFTGPQDLYDFLYERFRITREEYDAKADWMKEELKKEHEEYLCEKKRVFSRKISPHGMTHEEIDDWEYESEIEGLYDVLRDAGVPFDDDGYPLGIG